MKELYQVKTRPQALEGNIVVGENYRITVLTAGLLRLEYSEDGIFEDRATKMAFYRDFPLAEYRVVRRGNGIEILTERLHLIYNEKNFTDYGLSIQVKGNLSAYHSIWRYGEEIKDLGGTARTLDMADGETPLEHGVSSFFGYSVLDDSTSHVLLEDGWIEPRKKGIQDLYFFGYGHDYKEALRDFYYLCGKTPMLPRYALGNWWSRYYPYSEQGYLELMDRFEKEGLPFSVAVIDMDWHVTDIDPKYGSGWTGYTWNKELFPDPERFLSDLHRRGLKTTLNVHPADGVRAYEEMYTEMAEALGVDAASEDPINFDVEDPDFMEAYFHYLHEPREKEGVDFWWIDWQQGSKCHVEGLDPLWILNHYHFLDNAKSGKRPMVFSRYAGPGSHRYPVGFSGDTITTWKSLDFQPHFTAVASNIGFGWWSHDIGGHMMGFKDDEMAARWLQFGVYSPILRLHSSWSEFNAKEPWNYKKEAELVMKDALRERHRMIPYLYTMNYRSWKEDLPLVCPMYYEYPEEKKAYQVPNQYYFGSGLVVAPVTTPRIQNLNVAKVNVWLPEGLWYDIHTGMAYDGGRSLDMYRMLTEIPVLAKAGSIIPFLGEAEQLQIADNPKSLLIKVFAGDSGSFTLYEDDNETCGYEQDVHVLTEMEYEEGDQCIFTIHPAKGTLSLIPAKRSFCVELTGYRKTEQVRVLADGEEIDAAVDYCDKKQAVIVSVPETDVTSRISICLDRACAGISNQTQKRCFAFLNQAEISFTLKDVIYERIRNVESVPVLIAELASMNLNRDLYGALVEILTAKQ